MKKIMAIIGIATAILFSACRATVNTPKTHSDVKVGAVKQTTEQNHG